MGWSFFERWSITLPSYNGIDWSVTKSISVELLMQNWLKFEMLF